MATFTAKPVGNLLRAKSVAIIGASQKGAWPQGIYRNLKGAKFPGGVYLINPNYQELYGDKCYPNLAACPEVPDELLILIPTRAVLGVLEEAAKLGTRSATIYTAGFGEGDDEKGKERAQQMRELCDRTGMVICGPNCMGSYSVGEGLWTFPTATPLLKKGPVGLIFQSGGSLGNWIKGATERGIGFSYAISSGNEVSLDLVDYLSFLIDDPDTKVITLMVEGIRRPDEFMAEAEQSITKRQTDTRREARPLGDGQAPGDLAHGFARRRRRSVRRHVQTLGHHSLPDLGRHDRNYAGVHARTISRKAAARRSSSTPAA